MLNWGDSKGDGVVIGAKPIIKWAGGKRQLLPELREMMPKGYNRYFEPFFGGGALFFDVCPKDAVISDLNPQLMELYRVVRDSPDKLFWKLHRIQNEYCRLSDDVERCECYYKKRAEFNQKIKEHENDADTSALMIFLNKAGYNGLYRTNRKGEMNVPAGHRKNISLADPLNFMDASEALKRAKILSGDFEYAVRGAKAGDFVFFDSPYVQTFTGYTSAGFSDDDHMRLSELFRRLSDNGVYCMLTNSNTDLVHDLYEGFNIRPVGVRRSINSDGKGRTGEEVIITNY